MEFARLLHQAQPAWAIVENEVAFALDGDLYERPRKGPALGPLAEFTVLNPVTPHKNKVIMLLGNWHNDDHRDGPGIFLKPPTAIINPGEPVIYPKVATRVNLEPELGVVIGQVCADVSVEEAKARVLGFTVSNDVTATQTRYEVNMPLLYGKCFDTFGIMGPKIVTDLDPRDLTLRAAMNGEPFLEISTGRMIWDAYEIVSWISRVATLYPGDLISMGAPPGFNARDAHPGDRMRVSIDGIGAIENPVRAA